MQLFPDLENHGKIFPFVCLCLTVGSILVCVKTKLGLWFCIYMIVHCKNYMHLLSISNQ